MRYIKIVEIAKFNPYHDARGRFASNPGGTANISDLARSGALSKYEYIGVRTLTPDEKYSVGDTCRESYDWDHEQDRSTYETDRPVTLGGTCSIGINRDRYLDEPDEVETALNNALKASNLYEGDRKVIIGGDIMEYGEDPGEHIIANAEVLAVYDPKNGKWITSPPKKTSKPTKRSKEESSKTDDQSSGPKITREDVDRYRTKLEDDYLAAHPGANRYSVFPNLSYDQRSKFKALQNYASTGDKKWIDGLDLSDVPIGKSNYDYITIVGDNK